VKTRHDAARALSYQAGRALRPVAESAHATLKMPLKTDAWGTAALVVFAGVAACLGAGCAPRRPEAGSVTRRTAPERARQKAERLAEKTKADALGGAFQGATATLFDPTNGRIVARVKSARGALGQTVRNGKRVARLADGEATLYDKEGRPVLFLRANVIEADPQTQQVVGTGNVRAVSLAQPGAPTLQADRITWTPKDRVVRGAGNVLITRDAPDARVNVPGRAFEADMTIRRFTVWGDGQTATIVYNGSFSPNSMKNKTLVTTVVAAATLTTAMASRTVPPAQAAPDVKKPAVRRQGGNAAGTTRQRIGNVTFTLPNFNTVQYEQPDSNSTRVVIDGKEPAVVTSARYDLAAPKMQVLFRRAKPGAPFQVVSANLSGSVRVVVRTPLEPGDTGEPRHDTVTCDNATYAALDTPGDVGRIDLKGNVRLVSRGGIFVEPAVSFVKSAVIILRRDGTQSVTVNEGSATGTVRERAPRPKNGGGNR